MIRLVAKLGLLLTLAIAWPAAADPARFAVVIGADRGLPDEVQLRYAEQDAARMGKVLVQLASVPEENLLVLQGAPAKHVRSVLTDVAARVARLRVEQPTARPMLIVYYSGHSSATGLHLGNTQLAFAELRASVQAVGADLAVYVIDGCRSGGLARSKGGMHAAAFTITDEPALQNKGTAVLASAADNEDAQESDRLGGGVFTTHVIAGLRGAADADADKRVTLSEAYAYAYRETLLTTSRLRVQQHPTYQLQLEGGQDVTLSRMDNANGLATLRFADAGRYVLVERGNAERVVTEFQLERPLDVLVPPGRYLLRHLGSRVVHEGRVEVDENQVAPVALASMSEVPYGTAVRRGLSQESVVSLNADVGASTPLLTGFSAGKAVALGAAMDLSSARLQARLRYGWADAQNAEVAVTQQTAGADVAAFHVFDVPAIRAGVGVGVRVGVDRFSQTFATTGVAPDRATWVWRAAPVLRLEFAPHPRWLAGVECGLDVYVMRVAHGPTSAWEAPVAPSCSLTGGWYLP